MYSEHLSALWCPHCHRTLTQHDGDNDHGTVVCTSGHTFVIRSGVLDLLGAATPLSMAAWSNEWTITAWLYERIWRPFALTLLSGQSYPYPREQHWLCSNGVAPQGVVVDVACSNGLYARMLAQAYPHTHVIGIDRALPMLVEAVIRARRANLRISYVRADARALPLKTACAATVVIGGSWNEMEELPQVFAEMARISAPRATLLAMALLQSRRRLGRLVQRVLRSGGVQFFDAQTLTNDLRRAGWEMQTPVVTGLVWQGVGTRTQAEEITHGQS